MISVLDDPTFHREKCERCAGRGRLIPDAVLGPELRGRRDEAGVLKEAMAKACGISPAYLYDLERGKRHWDPELIVKYEKALGAPPPSDPFVAADLADRARLADEDDDG